MSGQETELVSRRKPPPGKLTFEQFHDWLDDTTWAEWVDGEVWTAPRPGVPTC